MIESALWWLVSWIPWAAKQLLLGFLAWLMPGILAYIVWKWYGKEKVRSKVAAFNAKVPALMRIPLPQKAEGVAGQTVYVDREVSVYKPSLWQQFKLFFGGLLVGSVVASVIVYVKMVGP